MDTNDDEELEWKVGDRCKVYLPNSCNWQDACIRKITDGRVMVKIEGIRELWSCSLMDIEPYEEEDNEPLPATP